MRLHPVLRQGPLLLLLAFAGALLAALPASGQGGFTLTEKAIVELHLDRTAYTPGETARAAAEVTIEPGWHIQSHQPTFDYLIPTVLHLEVPAGWRVGELRYPPDQMWMAGFAEEELAVYEGTVSIVASLGVPADTPLGTEIDLVGTLTYQACDDKVCLRPAEATAVIRLTVAEGGEPIDHQAFAVSDEAAPASAGGAPGRSGPGLLTMIGLGLLGGLILNAMPCVLPVLSLKVFGLVDKAGKDRRHVALGALATTAGILVSFWALAAAAVATRAAGEAVGWGIQFQNPGFVAFLTVVVVFFSLNLWGLFEIPLPAALGGAGGGHREGLAGHFGTGLFATLMATPCSAPFLGSAVGFALSQPTGLTLVMFTAVGVGMASPYLLLAAAPGAARALPRPGPWMEVVRAVMGFLLAGAAVWLLYVLSAQIVAYRLAFFEGALLLLGLFAWLKRRAAHSGASSWPASAAMAATAVLAVALAVTAAPAARGGESAGRIAWQAFDEAEAIRLADQGALVFVDVTADWCATCKINERAVLESDEVVTLFERHHVIPMQADWTNRDDRIADYLARFGRYAIPFYALYRPGQEPHVFGELLTRGTVVAVVEGSSRARPLQTADR
ncbi:MAG TPA: thioredoxin family protein [Thermoanaerobaculia bacterium]|nr:thioredoxin family protein [Thermoanaerobaculia bacterium]